MFVRIGIVALVLMAPAATAAGLLTAGDIDDHLNWQQYVDFVAREADGQNQSSGLPALDFSDRITLEITDGDGRRLPFAEVELMPAGAPTPTARLHGGTDGVVRILPSFDGLPRSGIVDVFVRAGGQEIGFPLDLNNLTENRTVPVVLEGAEASAPETVELLIVMDSTGSMADELNYITAELESIVGQIVDSNPGVAMRLGLTVYRDQGDAYVVRSLGFADGIAQMQSWLAAQQAAGGGDYPEAMDRALQEAVHADWGQGDAVRMVLLVADAPPHPGGYDPFIQAAVEARTQGIHIHPLAASGAAEESEYLMRAAAVLTGGRYMFLTDDSGLGNAHKEPSIACYLVTSLQDLLVRVVQSEIEGRRVEPDAQDVVRAVGSYDRGVCLAAEDKATAPEQGGGSAPAGSAAPGSDSGASAGGTGATGTIGGTLPVSEDKSHIGDEATETRPRSDAAEEVVSDGGAVDGEARSHSLAAPVVLLGIAVAMAAARVRGRRRR